MAQPRLRARFFVDPTGTVIPKAPRLKRSEWWKFYDSCTEKLCRWCGRQVQALAKFSYNGPLAAHVDHVLPRARGGQNNRENLVLSCVSCNESKGAK